MREFDSRDKAPLLRRVVEWAAKSLLSATITGSGVVAAVVAVIVAFVRGLSVLDRFLIIAAFGFLGALLGALVLLAWERSAGETITAGERVDIKYAKTLSNNLWDLLGGWEQVVGTRADECRDWLENLASMRGRLAEFNGLWRALNDLHHYAAIMYVHRAAGFDRPDRLDRAGEEEARALIRGAWERAIAESNALLARRTKD